MAPRLLAQVADLDDEALAARARELAGEISAAEAALAAVLAEVERRELHERWECHTVERFATWQCQLSPSRAAGLATVGRAMPELPVVAEAVADGTLSFDKAHCIARTAAAHTEGALVQMALHATVGQTQRICGAWRRADPSPADADDSPTDDDSPTGGDEPRPTVLVVLDEDGVEIRARFDHVRGQLVLAGLEAATRQVRTERRHAAPIDQTAGAATAAPACPEDLSLERLSAAEWRAEGLLRLAGAFRAEQSEGLQPSGFDSTLVFHVGIDTIHGPDIERAMAAHRSTVDPAGGPAGEVRPPTAPGDASPPSTPIEGCVPGRDDMAILEPAGVRIRRDLARAMACDAGLLTVVEDADGNPLHLGRRTASIPPSLRRAVHARHRTCAWPGCTATAVQLHHVHHRARGGHDDVENLVPQCLGHHRTVHERDVTITIERDGAVRHWRPDGTEIVAVPSRLATPTTDAVRAPGALARRRRALGADPDEPARMPRWRGDPLDLGLALDALVSRRRAGLARTASAGSPPAPPPREPSPPPGDPAPPPGDPTEPAPGGRAGPAPVDPPGPR